MARMRKLTTVRSLSIAVAGLVLITGCGGTGKGPAQPGATIFSPTGAPSGLTQIEGAKGEQVPLGDGPWSTRVNLKTGAKTIDYAVEVTAQAAADLGLKVAKAKASASGTVKVKLAVTRNRAGDPIRVVAQGQAVGDASAQVTDLFGGGGRGRV